MKQFWSRRARNLTPYVPGEQPKVSNLIKLNTNENPYPPSAAVLSAMQAAVNEDLRRYPDPNSTVLCTAVAEKYGLQTEQVFAGNGSDEVLSLAFYALFDSEKAIKVPDISYSFYPVYANYYEVQQEIIPVNEDFTIPVERFFGAEGGVVLANPNAPTGIALCLADVRRILEGNPAVPVIIDEAYIDFGGESAVTLIDEFPNLLVVHTLSKFRSLAGLRVGYAMGQADLIAALDTVKNSFNSYPLDRIALAGAAAAIEDGAYFTAAAEKISATRSRVMAALEALDFTVCPSAANFIFAAHATVAAQEIFAALRERNILVRYWNQPRIFNQLRISIGTDEEMDVFLAAVSEIVGER
jgi:histidinol-phosphate aminotransferase